MKYICGMCHASLIFPVYTQHTKKIQVACMTFYGIPQESMPKSSEYLRECFRKTSETVQKRFSDGFFFNFGKSSEVFGNFKFPGKFSENFVSGFNGSSVFQLFLLF